MVVQTIFALSLGPGTPVPVEVGTLSVVCTVLSWINSNSVRSSVGLWHDLTQ